jgi:hypothetical protein
VYGVGEGCGFGLYVSPVATWIAPYHDYANTGTTITLSWTGGTQTGFRIEQSNRFEDGTTSWLVNRWFEVTTSLSSPNVRSYDVTGLVANTVYYFRVIQINGDDQVQLGLPQHTYIYNLGNPTNPIYPNWVKFTNTNYASNTRLNAALAAYENSSRSNNSIIQEANDATYDTAPGRTAKITHILRTQTGTIKNYYFYSGMGMEYENGMGLYERILDNGIQNGYDNKDYGEYTLAGTFYTLWIKISP